ncbi:MAG TPA: fibronectin type III domain-containing protein, partial [Isosphaeraceae bacterium]
MRRPTRARALSRLRPASPKVDLLEVRQLLSTAPLDGPYPVAAAGQTVRPLYEVGRLVVYPTPPAGAYTPAQVASAYGFNAVSFGSVKGDGTGQTIAIVDTYDDPNIQADLNAFDAQFGLPATTVTRVGQSATSALPGTDSTGGWELEESLDVEWAHAIAPGAKIVLVEAKSTSDTDLLSGVAYASSMANVVSMSWGGGEFSGENTYDGNFSKAGVAFVASSGDSGAPISWPAASPNVLAVGGTALTLGSGNTYGSESGWSGSGGGPSGYESQPSYQSGVVTQTTMRANPDVSYDASSSTGFAVYDSFNYNGTSYGWMQVGGTSAGAPQWAALLAIADQGRALSSQPALDNANAQQVQATLYANRADFHDVTTGSSTGSPNYSAGVGYDYVTGLGSPIANLVIQSLDGTVTAPPSDHLIISSSTTDVAGNALSVTVTADNASNATDAGFTGTVNFSSTDAQAGLPSSYTFTPADKGSHTFGVTLKTAGSQTVTASDAAISSTATTPSIAVSPAAAGQFLLSGLSSTATAGASQSFTVTAKDPYGNVATGYTGTVNVTSSDATISPIAYTFTAADAGKHAFGLTFKTAGTQSVTAADTTTTKFSATQSGITVSPAAPVSLAATAVSTSQINLTWTGSVGATGYTIQRSLSSTGGWAQVGTTAAGTTTYADTGLATGTAYYYRVQATGGSGSGYSNTASAATTGTSPAPTTDTLWSNSYTPSENYYGSGSY